MRNSALNQIDFYKTGHHLQYPRNSEYVYSNFTARSGSKSNIKNGKGIIFIGLQLLNKDYLIDEWNETFFNQEHDYIVGRYKKLISTALQMDIDVDHISALHKIGYLPIKIKALPEGAFVPYKIPVLTIVNTDPRFYWLPNYLESVLSTELWPVCTSATTYFQYMKVLNEYAEITGANKQFIPFQIHDFSFRGMYGREAAAKSAFAAIACGSMGTDSVPGIDIAENYYNAMGFIAGSIPATEHSVMSSNIEIMVGDMCNRSNAELIAFERLITEVYPSGNISIVSDTFDFWNVVETILPALKSTIMCREGRVVIRPDSGDPVDIICGRWNSAFKDFDLEIPASQDIESCVENFKSSLLSWNLSSCDPDDIEEESHAYFKYKNVYYKISIRCEWRIQYADGYDIKYDRAFLDDYTITYDQYTPSCQELGLIESLWNIFGGTYTEKGYKTLDSHIGAIYGDSITLERQKQILERLKEKGFASDNIVFGVGSYSYQYVTRDTHGFAMKATSIVVDSKRYDIYKDPKTDNGTKKSARGLLMVIYKNGQYELVDQCNEKEESHGCLETVFENGKLIKEVNLEDVRNRVKENL